MNIIIRIILITLGIIILIIILTLVASSLANIRFNQQVQKEVSTLFAASTGDDSRKIIQEADLEGLPSSVQKWLKYSQVVGKTSINTVYSQQKVFLRTKESQPWMPAETDSYYTVNKPGFIWKARIKAAPLVHLVGRDMYYEGRGHMKIKLLSLITVADARGEEIDQGSLLRYMAEMVWFPTAALNSYMSWEEVSSNSAKATLSYQGVIASGLFRFNDLGEPVEFEAERYMESNGQYSLETWLVKLSDYQAFNHILVPTKGEVIWKLDTGDFPWYRFEVTTMDYNRNKV